MYGGGIELHEIRSICQDLLCIPILESAGSISFGFEMGIIPAGIDLASVLDRAKYAGEEGREMSVSSPDVKTYS